MNNSKIALGTVHFGLPYGIANTSGQVSVKEIETILSLARDAGINTLDTAIGYGESEEILGKIGIKDFKVITKIPPIPAELPNVEGWLEEQLHNSLKRLRVPQIYGLLLHRSENLKGKEAERVRDTLLRLKSSGIVQKVGVSVYDPQELESSIQAMPLSLVQAPLNVLDRRLETSGWLRRLSNEGVEIHTRSVFLQGLLLMCKESRPSFFNQWSGIWDRWHQWLDHHKILPLEACLCFLLKFQKIDRVVVGIDSTKQLNEILKSISGELPVLPSELSTDDTGLLNPSNWKLT